MDEGRTKHPNSILFSSSFKNRSHRGNGSMNSARENGFVPSQLIGAPWRTFLNNFISAAEDSFVGDTLTGSPIGMPKS